MSGTWAGLGAAVISFLYLYDRVANYIPFQIRDHLATFFHKVVSFVNPYDQITIHEYCGEYMQRDELYVTSEAYLSSTCSSRARKLKADMAQESDKPSVTIDDYEEVIDTFRGVSVWWCACMRPNSHTISFYPNQEQRKYYRLTFHNRHRKLVQGEYLKHVLREGRDVTIRNRIRKLFTNNSSSNSDRYSSLWSHVAFEHPATFDTLAMDPKKKREIIDDLVTFCKGKEYYKKIGKAWKRGYLLYGPPGTGKSTMIAAIANFLEYDVYDLELTTVKTNTELRKIFIETTGKSIIVIEDIDCSIDLTGKRKEKEDKDDEEKDEKLLSCMEEKDENSKLTLSGILNFIDGLWSACGGERIVIFTTNHVEKLDPALIRRGRMDMHIEMSYCTFEAFKVLAKNYLGILEHELFDTIQTLLSEVNISPADVAEGLMLKISRNEDVGACLMNLIRVIEAAKEEAKKKAQQKLAAQENKKSSKEEPSVEKTLDLEEKLKNSKSELAP
ncbi:P-loop containing nucleoside triphosphate hydrolases superfamily protein [Rhynchospora pubera]|uniref:P-loop containing nucleoside triphosphate hydrolases superfamily protein n=1 Tax=Rhynchospora pubera TaxID=906938 RepID=A0AAV8HAK4_9POAL|nr:P-loop containing nucleoside triphosphate hydrolases superfamily protein [Rhynchospora pubera]